MKYKKAQDILPQYMIDDLQQYIEGGYLYIPKKEENSGKKADCYNNFQNDHHFIPFCSSLVYKWYRDLYLMDCVTSSHPSISMTSYTL